MDMIVMFGLLFLCISISIPIGIAIGIATLVTFAIFIDTPLMTITQSCITGLDSFTMLAIPFFIMAGIIMGKGGIATRLVDTFHVLVGHVTGGLGLVTVVTCGFFGSISGSSNATVAAIGGFMIPEMVKRGYDPGFAASVTACSATTSLLIPPSLLLVLYGVTTNTSIGDLFIAGIIPGFLMVLALCFGNFYYAKKYNFKGVEKHHISEFLKALWAAKWAILCPIIILGGIYTGIFTPTEASVVAVVYAIFIGFFVYKDLTFQDLKGAMVDTMKINGMVLYLLGISLAFSKYLSLAMVPPRMVEWIVGITDNPIILMLIINVALLIIGCPIDSFAMVIVLSPLLLPIAETTGMSAVTFGVVMVLNTTIGIITPPYGGNLFIGTSIAGITMERFMKYFWAFFFALIIVLMMITYIPILTTALL